MYLDQQDQDGLAKFITQCQIDKRNLIDMEKAYNVCAEKNELALGWWQTPAGIASIGFTSFLLGIVAAQAAR